MSSRDADRPLDPDAQADLDAMDDAIAGRSVDPSRAGFAELATELHALREEPRPDFLASLDERLGAQIGAAAHEERQAAADARLPKPVPLWRRRLFPALAIGLPAAAAVVIAVVLISDTKSNQQGPGKLPVSVQSADTSAAAASGGAAAPARGADVPQALDRPGGPTGPGLRLASSEVPVGDPLVVRYAAPEPATVFVVLTPAGTGQTPSTKRVELPAGTGRIKIATDDLDRGSYRLVVSLPDGDSALRRAIQLD